MEKTGNKKERPLILLIDDSQINRDMMKEVLTEEYRYIEASNGEEGIKLIKANLDKIALVLLDIIMPVKDGYEVLSEMNKMGWIDEVPVIIVSETDTYDDIERTCDWGAIDYISKTSSAGIVRNRVKNIIRLFTNQKRRLIMAKEEVRHLTFMKEKDERIDALTGCLKRNAFFKTVSHYLNKQSELQYALVYVDVKNLAYINNECGYDVGNKLLQIIGDTVNSLITEEEVIGRVSGDRFITLLSCVIETVKKRQVFSEVVRRMNKYMEEMGFQYNVQLHAGMYIISDEDIQKYSVEQMSDLAGLAHKKAKREDTQEIIVYNKDQLERQRRDAHILFELDDAIANNEIQIWFQPQIDSRSDSIVGAEVLCRWNSATLGWISPMEFIPLLENNGQITKLDSYVWEEACKQLKKWKDSGIENVIPLSINVSRRDILDMRIEDKLLGLVEKYDLSVDMLRTEITESAYMEKPEQLIEVVKSLKEKGFTVEMDDFGSGYSSLNMLKEVPVDVLKLDLRFLKNGDSENGGAIISSIIRMAKGINLQVVAEGVEYQEQCIALRNMGCTIIQGYYYAKPMPINEFEDYVHNHNVIRTSKSRRSSEWSHLREVLETTSNSSYIFESYCGSSAIIEMTGDHMEVLKINQRFLQEMGDRGGEALKYVSNGLFLIDDSQKEMVGNTIKQAIEEGFAECEAYLPNTEQWIKLFYRLIIKEEVSSYLSCEAYNTTQFHN